jgi:selenocysteine-specific elongation factor
MQEPDPDAALCGLLAQASQGVDLAAFCRARNVAPEALALPGDALRLGAPGAETVLGAAQATAVRERVLATLARFHAQFEDEQGPDSARLRRMACPELAAPAVLQVVRDLFYAPGAIARLARIGAALEAEDGGVRAAAFRDRGRIGRKRTVQILEFFDRIGYTRRIGDLHRLRSDNLLQLDAAPAPREDTLPVP